MPSLSNRFGTDANWNMVEQLEAFCERKGHKLVDLAFSWLLARASVSSVIAGATKPEQVEQNVAAAAWALTPEEVASGTFDGLEAGEDEVFPGALSRGAAEAFKNNPAALQAQLSTTVHAID